MFWIKGRETVRLRRGCYVLQLLTKLPSDTRPNDEQLSGAAVNDGGLIGRHGHAGAVMVGLGAGNYGGGFGGPAVGGGQFIEFEQSGELANRDQVGGVQADGALRIG